MFTPEEIKSIKDKRVQRSGGGIWKMVFFFKVVHYTLTNPIRFSFRSSTA